MRAVIQRVSKASVTIDQQLHSSIETGLLILIGIEEVDDATDIEWLSNKIISLRIFNDENGIMNKSVQEIEGEILLVSQFTLHASTKKGNRPSYIKAARPATAIPLYEKMKKTISEKLGKPVRSGSFGADMKVELLNDGPVTIIIDSRNRE